MSDRTPRPSKAVVQRRIEELLRIILDGAEPGWDICEYVREQEQTAGSIWHVPDGGKPLSYSQIRRYAAQAEKLISASCRASRKKLLRRHLARRRNLFAKCVSMGDMRAALACLDSEARLLGLFAPTKVAPVTPEGDLPYPMSDAERAAALSRLYAAVGAADGDATANRTDDAEAHASGAGAGERETTAPAGPCGAVVSAAAEGDVLPLFP